MQNDLTRQQNNDTYLMSRAKDGDAVAFGMLYIKYRSALIDYLTAIGNVDGRSEDFAHDVFVRIWENRHSFRGDSAFRTYMLSIARNAVCERNRRIKREDVAYRQLVLISNRRSEPDAEAVLLQAERMKSIEESMSKLPEKQRQALELTVGQDISPELAAAQAGCSRDAYRRRIHDARKHLRRLLREIDPT